MRVEQLDRFGDAVLVVSAENACQMVQVAAGQVQVDVGLEGLLLAGR